MIDGYLVDHEPPYRIITNLSQNGIHWKKGEQVKIYDTAANKLELFNTPDELDFEVAEFNKKVLTEPFNKAVCQWLAGEIDPSLPEKTLIFCANDRHADMVVKLLKEAFQAKYDAVEDDAVLKITGAADQPLALIRRFRNERLPNVAVTVDLLTTGIDVLTICNLVFIRKVNSRILYEQMLGRATRRCDEIHKEAFRIFDAVDIYKTMQDYSDMKPVVSNPNISFRKLEEEIKSLKDTKALNTAREQFIVKLRRKRHHLDAQRARDFEIKTGVTPDQFIKKLKSLPVQAVADWFIKHPGLGELLDQKGGTGPRYVVVSDHDDEIRDIERGYGEAIKPADYIKAFTQFIKDNTNKIAALKLVLQRPGALTRAQLRELQLKLEEKGYREQDLKGFRTRYSSIQPVPSYPSN